MSPKNDLAPEASTREFVVTRVFDAPRELVFRAWSEAEHLAHWWGPKGCAIQVLSLDFRPGGVFHYSMTTPAGQQMWGKFVYREIVAPERIVFINSFADEAGAKIKAPFDMDFPLETYSTVALEEQGGKTKLTLRGIPHHATEAQRETFEGMFDSMNQGWNGTLDQLTDYLAKA